jgi:peptidoglycan/xylan/chitin deacetylase (PgdA/CDA1 family)
VLIFRLLRLSLVPLLVRETLQRHRATIVTYHDPDPRRFEEHVQRLRRLYTIIDLRSFVDAQRDGGVAQLPLKPMVITLDDGRRGNRELLPVLERLGVPVTVFLCASIVGSNRRYWFNHTRDGAALKLVADAERLERLRAEGFQELGGEREALSDDEVREMAGPLVDFQSHGLSHPIIPRCDDAKARAEIVGSRQELATRYGFDIFAFAYPNGDYSDRERDLVREAGYRCALTLDLGFNNGSTDPFRLRRVCIDDADGLDELVVKASGVWGAIRRFLGGRAAGDAAYR